MSKIYIVALTKLKISPMCHPTAVALWCSNLLTMYCQGSVDDPRKITCSRKKATISTVCGSNAVAFVIYSHFLTMYCQKYVELDIFNNPRRITCSRKF